MIDQVEEKFVMKKFCRECRMKQTMNQSQIKALDSLGRRVAVINPPNLDGDSKTRDTTALSTMAWGLLRFDLKNKKKNYVIAAVSVVSLRHSLQEKDKKVTILEKATNWRFRVMFRNRMVFVFAGGPTISPAPWLIDEMFEAAARKTSDYVKLVKIDRLTFDSRRNVFNYNDDKEFIKPIALQSGRCEGYKRFSKDRRDTEWFELIDQPLQKWDMLKVFPNGKAALDRSVYKIASRISKESGREALAFTRF